MKNLWDVDVKLLQAYSNDKKNEWRELEETVTVIARTIDVAIQKVRKYSFPENNGSFKSDESKEIVKFWVAKITVISVKSRGTVENI